MYLSLSLLLFILFLFLPVHGFSSSLSPPLLSPPLLTFVFSFLLVLFRPTSISLRFLYFSAVSFGRGALCLFSFLLFSFSHGFLSAVPLAPTATITTTGGKRRGESALVLDCLHDSLSLLFLSPPLSPLSISL